MQKWEVCKIEEKYIDVKLFGTSKIKYVANLFKVKGEEVINESQECDKDSKESRTQLRILVAVLGDNGWEPMPIPTNHVNETSRIIWYFKRPKSTS